MYLGLQRQMQFEASSAKCLLLSLQVEDKPGQKSKIPQDICDWLMECSGEFSYI